MRLDSELLALERKLALAEDQVSLTWRDVARLGQQTTEAGRAGLGQVSPPVQVIVKVAAFGTIPGFPAPPSQLGTPQLPGVVIDVYLAALGVLVGSGVTDSTGNAVIVCGVDARYVTYSLGFAGFTADITATPPAPTSARFTGPVTASGAFAGFNNTVDVQLSPATGYDFWLLGVGTPLKSALTITDSVVGTLNVTQGGGFSGTMTYNYAGVLGGCAAAAALPVTYILPLTSHFAPFANVPYVIVQYPVSSTVSDCPVTSGAYTGGGSFGGGSSSLVFSPFTYSTSSADKFTSPPCPLYTSTATITVTET